MRALTFALIGYLCYYEYNLSLCCTLCTAAHQPVILVRMFVSDM